MEAQRAAEQAIEKFLESGPYTFDRVLAVAKLCALTDNIRLNLDAVMHQFSDTEMRRLLTAKTHCSKRAYGKLFRGIEPFFSLPSVAFARMSLSQLRIFSDSLSIPEFGYIFDSTHIEHLTSDEKFAYLTLAQASQQRHLTK